MASTTEASTTRIAASAGTPRPTSGRRVSADSGTTSNATVPPASRRPSRSMATRSVVGSTCNATGIPKAPLDADRERRLRDLTGLDLGPQGRPPAPDRAPVRPHHGQPRAVRRAARLEGQPRPRPGSARQARRAGPYGAHPELRRRRPRPAGAVPRLRPPRPRPDREAAHGLKPSS